MPAPNRVSKVPPGQQSPGIRRASPGRLTGQGPPCHIARVSEPRVAAVPPATLAVPAVAVVPVPEQVSPLVTALVGADPRGWRRPGPSGGASPGRSAGQPDREDGGDKRQGGPAGGVQYTHRQQNPFGEDKKNRPTSAGGKYGRRRPFLTPVHLAMQRL